MTFGPEAFTFFYRKWVGFVTAALLMSVLQGLACYAASFRPGALLALGGNTGNHIYDVRVFRGCVLTSVNIAGYLVLHRPRT